MCHLRINPTLPKSRESKRTHTQNQQSGTRSSDALTYRIRFRCTHSPLPISVRRQVSNSRCVITSAFHTETRRNLSVTSLHGQRAPTPSHTSSLRASSVRARRSRQNTARRFTHRSCESMSPHPHEPRSLCSTPSSQPRAPRSADPRGRAEGDARPTRRAGERARQVEEAGEVRADGAELRTSTRSTRCALVPPPQASAEGSLPPTHTPTFVT